MDTIGFDARYMELLADLRRLCVVLGAGPDAEDVAQEVLIYGRSRVHQLRDDTKLAAWLRKMAVRAVARNRRRSSNRLRSMGPLVDRSGGLVDLALDERDALRRLGRRQRQLISLVYFAGYRQEEVAEMLGISRGTVAKTLWLARCALAQSLVEYHKELP